MTTETKPAVGEYRQCDAAACALHMGHLGDHRPIAVCGCDESNAYRAFCDEHFAMPVAPGDLE